MDVLEDSFRLRQYPVERIDGSVSSRDRQAAIDRYSKGKLTMLLGGYTGGGGLAAGACTTGADCREPAGVRLGWVKSSSVNMKHEFWCQSQLTRSL